MGVMMMIMLVLLDGGLKPIDSILQGLNSALHLLELRLRIRHNLFKLLH